MKEPLSNCCNESTDPCLPDGYDRGYKDGFDRGHADGFEVGELYAKQQANGVIPAGYRHDIDEWERIGKEREYWSYYRKEAAKELYDLLSSRNKGEWLRILNQFQ